MNSTDAETGVQLARAGRFADALPYLERANRSAPTDVPILHAVASVLQWAGRSADAEERYRFAADLLPADISVLTGWARSLLLIGARDQAIQLLERALVLDPHYADPRGMFDMLLWEANDADAACGLLQPLVARHPEHPALLRQYANALLAAEHLDDARAAYERYRSMRPKDPLACVELGRLAVSRGESDEAMAHFRSALEIDPTYAAALWEVAQASGWRLEPQTLALIQDLIQSEQDPKALAGLHDILARYYDKVDEFKVAAIHATRTNALMAQLVPPQKRYSEQQHEREVDAAIRNNTPQLLDRLRDAGSRERRPVFIIGLPRSGTTLLERMLASHPAIVGIGEQSLARSGLQRALTESGGVQSMLTASAVGNAANWHLQMLDDRLRRLAIDSTSQRVVDKLPDNYMFAGWLRIAFPNAAIIHCLRDPRDVALSCWLTQFSQIQWSFELGHIAHRIEQHRRLMRHWRAAIGDHLTEVRYERLVADPETEIRRALAAIHVDWHPDVLAFSERKGFVSSASRQQVREPLHARSVERWRNYEDALQPILPRMHAIAAQDALEAGPGTVSPDQARDIL